MKEHWITKVKMEEDISEKIWKKKEFFSENFQIKKYKKTVTLRSRIEILQGTKVAIRTKIK